MVRTSFQVHSSNKGFLGSFCSDGVLKTAVANVSQPSIPETMIILHCVHIGVGTS